MSKKMKIKIEGGVVGGKRGREGSVAEIRPLFHWC